MFSIGECLMLWFECLLLIQGVGISYLMCVGWLPAILTGHMIPFWNPWDQTSALGVIQT